MLRGAPTRIDSVTNAMRQYFPRGGDEDLASGSGAGGGAIVGGGGRMLLEIAKAAELLRDSLDGGLADGLQGGTGLRVVGSLEGFSRVFRGEGASKRGESGQSKEVGVEGFGEGEGRRRR